MENERNAGGPVKILRTGGVGEIIEKKSRFIATLCPVNTEEEAVSFIERTKKKYWDARHNCSAFVIGDRAELTRCSDDGEPPHTAGRPMLDILLKEEVRNVCVVVTRYFGGVLLGTGGLVRAYQDAVKAGLAASETAEKRTAVPVTVTTDYTAFGKLSAYISREALPVLRTDYGEGVTQVLLVPPEGLAAFSEQLSEASFGQAELTKGDPVSFLSVGSSIEFP